MGRPWDEARKTAMPPAQRGDGLADAARSSFRKPVVIREDASVVGSRGLLSP
jgi:hypothetical protein